MKEGREAPRCCQQKRMSQEGSDPPFKVMGVVYTSHGAMGWGEVSFDLYMLKA